MILALTRPVDTFTVWLSFMVNQPNDRMVEGM